MRDPMLVPGLLVALGALSWPFWEPDPLPCQLGVGALALLALLPSSGRAGWWAGWAACLALGWAAPGLRTEGPRLEGWVSLRGELHNVVGRRAELALEGGGGRVGLILPERGPLAGARVAVFGRARPLRPVALPGAQDPVHDAALSRLRSTVYAKEIVVAGLADPDPDDPFAYAEHRGLLRALARGDRSGVSPEHTALLRRTGTSHLLAISGLHLGMLSALAVGACRWALRPLALLWPTRGDGWAPAAAGVGALLAFGGLVGWPVSARRAGVMVAGALVGLALGRGVRPWNLLGLAAAVVALTEPGALRQPGFALSFGAVAGVLTVGGRLMRCVPLDTPRVLKRLAEALAATLGATVGTLPMAAWCFQQLSIVGPLANLLAIPLVSLGVLPAALIGALGSLPAVALADASMGLTLDWLQRVDGPSLHPAVGPWGFAVLLSLPLLCRHPGLMGAVALLTLGLREVPAGHLEVTFLSVGQGDAALIELPEGQRLLVDGGPPGDRVLRWLRRRGIRRLDEVVLTHPHPDHSGGLEPVLEALKVGALRVPRGAREGEATYAALLAVAARSGVPLRLPGDPALPGVSVLHPHPAFLEEHDDVNEASVVLRVVHGEVSLLMTGDIEGAAEAWLAPHLAPVTLLKVPHHGSLTSTSPALLDATRPELALISCGPDNRYRHPRPEILGRLRGVGVYRTDVDGTVVLRSDGRSMRLRRWRPGEGWSPWIDPRVRRVELPQPAVVELGGPLPQRGVALPPERSPEESPPEDSPPKADPARRAAERLMLELAAGLSPLPLEPQTAD